MKWILLFILMSCGKHEEPKSIDTRDSDGDQVLNYEETDEDRYIAQYKNLGALKGSLKIAGFESTSIPFSNAVKAESGLEMFVKNPSKIEKTFFYEWSNLNLTITSRPNLPKSTYKILLHFDATEDKADELFFVSNERQYSIGTWRTYMDFFMPREDLESLLNGTAFLQARKKQWKSLLFDESSEDTIRKKTSRLFFTTDTPHSLITSPKT